MTKRLITVDDVSRFELATNPILSPNGTFVVYEKTVSDVKEDGYNTQLMMVSVDGGAVRALTSIGTNNSGATWSPDGNRVAFVSDRGSASQLFVLPMDGGEADQLTRFRYGMSSLVWSPNGTVVYGLVPVKEDGEIEVFAQDISDKEAKEEIEKENKEWANGPKRFDRLRYKMDGSGMSRNRYQQLVSVNVETGEYQQLTSGSFDVTSFDVSPDGTHLVFATNRSEDSDFEWWRSDVYRVSASGGEIELIYDKVSVQALTYSPDGRNIALIGHGEELFTYWSAAHLQLFVMSATGDTVRHLTKNFADQLGDTNLTDLRGAAKGVFAAWSKDGRYIYTLSTREGRSEVVRFDVSTDDSTASVVIGGDRDIYGFAFDGFTQFIVSYATQTDPSRIVHVNIEGTEALPRPFRQVTEPMNESPQRFFPQEEKRLCNSNLALLEELVTVTPEPFYYTSQDGWRVQGWVMKPAEYEAGKKYPVILEIHGGPQLNYGHAMFHEMQWLAAQGYAVVLTNPRGGMSYGQEFANGVRNKYGDGDAADVQNGLDAALAQFDYLDANRVAVTGGSYGGFMTNWLVGHTDRFFAAVSQRSISNWISFYGVSDIGPIFCESQHGCKMSDWEQLWKISPLAYVDNVSTPLLLIHSENDLRCPIEQAEQFFTCIKRNDGEVELLRIPNASHGLSRNGKPKLRVERLNAIFTFINTRLPQAEL